jgi:nucleotide-binding universal stress UspA family protein
MMELSTSTIFLLGVLTVALLTVFVYETLHQLRKASEPPAFAPGPATAEATRMPERASAPPCPMRLLVATDGSPCSAAAVRSVAQRPWPPGTEVEVVTVVHTNVPFVPDIVMVGAAVKVHELEEDRRQAPERVRQAERLLKEIPGLTVRSAILEGDPGKALVEEAERSKAHLLVVGSHGYGPVKRLVLGSVSQHVAAHAPCSVEIVRCPPG